MGSIHKGMTRYFINKSTLFYRFAMWSTMAMITILILFYIPTTEQGWIDEHPRPYYILLGVGLLVWQFIYFRSELKAERMKPQV